MTSGSGGSSTLTDGNIGGIEFSTATLAWEYVWGPGGSFVGAAVDELLVQLDGEGRASWVIQDAGGDVVALAVNGVSSAGGLANGANAVAATGVSASNTGTNLSFRVAAQQEYDAYGQVIWAEHLLNHAALHVGHKGLFVDRLDVGISELSGGMAATAKTFGEPPRIVPLAFNLAQNRNRVLHTGWGRYLQQDPNASGMGVLAAQSFNAASLDAAVDGLRLLGQFADGANLYQYVQGQPTLRGDPMGLYSWGDAGQDAMDIMGMMDPIPGPGDYIQGALKGMVQEYAARQEWDVDWATDWSLSDDMHSRNDSSWVEIAALEGVKEEFTIELPFTDDSVNPLDTGIGTIAAAESIPGQGPGRAAFDAKGFQNHHIATNKGDWGKKCDKLFREANMSIDDPDNIVNTRHGGRHADEYHTVIHKRLRTAVREAPQGAAAEALRSELRRLSSFLSDPANMSFPYNTADGKSLGWKGKRFKALSSNPQIRGKGRRR